MDRLGQGQRPNNLAAFNALKLHQEEIETTFGEALDWQELPESNGCRICKVVPGGYRSQPETWPQTHAALIDAMIRLDKSLRPHVHALKI